MPGTPEEFVALVAVLMGEGYRDADHHRWADGTAVAEAEWRDLLALVAYVRRMRGREARRHAQRKAMRLLRRMLSPDQRRQLAQHRHFLVATPSGATYRLDPRAGHAERVERHGRRWFAKRSYCLHDEPDAGKLPPADVTIGHLLLLLADEPAFLREANENRRDDQLWNGDYLRRLRARGATHREAS